uniref:Uncharacterized protein n=1 Tax=Aliivibrio fischeri TaxID=668 RepID=H2ES14_ALIFS|nr:hypothetical protein [Aliivibrio fischeri]AEY78181.1 hypothetical protein [Aliivibrio fischeri]
MSSEELVLPSKPMTSYQEAYLREIFSEIILLQKKLTEIGNESTMRIGITQNIIDEHLERGSKALDNYTQAANAHFSATKQELKDIADNEVKTSITKSLIDAHHQLLLANPPRIALRSVLMMTLVASIVASTIGLGGGYIAYNTLNKNRLSADEIQYIDKGRLLKQSWPILSPQTKKN